MFVQSIGHRRVPKLFLFILFTYRQVSTVILLVVQLRLCAHFNLLAYFEFMYLISQLDTLARLR